jgi:hypothetical protein
LVAFGSFWPELAELDLVPAERRRAVNAARNGAGGKAKIHNVKQRLVRTHGDPRQHPRKLQFHRPAPACWTLLDAFGSFWALPKELASQATPQPTIKFDISNFVKSEHALLVCLSKRMFRRTIFSQPRYTSWCHELVNAMPDLRRKHVTGRALGFNFGWVIFNS